MDVAEHLATLLSLTATRDAIERRIRELKFELHDEAIRRMDFDGAAPTWRVKGRGSVTLVVSDPHAGITNEGLYITWVADHYPLWLRDTVDPEMTSRLFTASSLSDDGQVITEEGEVVPGCGVVERPPYLMVRLDPGAKAAADLNLSLETFEP